MPWVGLAGPLVLSLALFMFLRSPYVLIGAVMGPALVLANWWDGRRRDRREQSRRDRDYRRDLVLWAADAEERDRRIVAKRHRAHPGIHVAVAQAGWVPGLNRQTIIRLGTVLESSADTGIVRRVPWCEDISGGIAVLGSGPAAHRMWRAAEAGITAQFGLPMGSGAGADSTRDASATAVSTLLWEGSISLTNDPTASVNLIIHCTGDSVVSVYRPGDIPHDGTWRVDDVSADDVAAVRARCAPRAGEVQAWRDRPAHDAGIAYDSAGEIAVSLNDADPHALVVGRTGSGKSEVIVAIVAALAATYSPGRWGCIMFDFKGGATARRVAELPHVWAVASDLDVTTATELLSLVAAEIIRRERVVESENVSTMSETESPERLVIVIDEFQAFCAQLPGAADVITDIARRGRSLGLHLVVSTQNPAGVVRDALNSNITTRVCAPMVSSHDVSFVLGVSGTPMPAVGQAAIRTADGVVRMGTVRRVTDSDIEEIAARYAGHKNRCPVPKNGAP